MDYKFGAPSHEGIVLTITPDLSINFPSLSKTELLLNQVVSPAISVIIIDLSAVTLLNFIGCWTLFQAVDKATKQGKTVCLHHVHPASQVILEELGVTNLSNLLQTRKELDKAVAEHIVQGDHH